MGKYDDIDPERLRLELKRFSEAISRLDAEGRLLEQTPQLLRRIGEIRRMLFAWEVRHTRMEGREPPPGAAPSAMPAGPDDGVEESLRIVREAIEREREFLERLTSDGDSGPAEGDV